MNLRRRRHGANRRLFRATVLCVVLWGTPVSGIDLLGVYDLATEHDAELRRAFHEHLAAQELTKQARAGFLPTLSADAETGWTRQNIRDSDNSIFSSGTSSFSTHRVTLSLSQQIYNHSNIVNWKQAKAAVRRSDLDFETARQDLLIRTASLYFTALAAQSEFEFAETERVALQLHYDLADLQRQKGLASITDRYDALARLATVEALVVEAEDQWDDAIQALKEISDLIPASLDGLDESLPLIPPSPTDVATWIEAADSQNPGLLAQREAVEVARQEVARQKSSRYPVLDLVARGNREKSGGTLFGGGNDVQTSNFLVRLSLPLYQGSVVASRVREAFHAWQSAEQELKRRERAVRREVRSAFYGVTRAISRVLALQEALMAQQLALDARQEGFRSGRYSTIEVLDAERDLFEVRRDHARARFDYVLNSLRLKQSVGTLSEADILTVNGWLE